jgi:hypothetical protein
MKPKSANNKAASGKHYICYETKREWNMLDLNLGQNVWIKTGVTPKKLFKKVPTHSL